MTEREREIWREWAAGYATYREVAAKLGISRQRVHQAVQRALVARDHA